MSDDYTPDTPYVRTVYSWKHVGGDEVADAEFDRWLESVRAEERARIARNIEAAGREDVGWLASHQDDRLDSARVVGAEDAWKAALRIVREGA
jgi:hypothetical protein